MSYQQINRWGMPPTPLVPANIIEVIGDCSAPYSFRKTLGEEAKIRDLGKDLWNEIDIVSGNQISELITLLRTYKAQYQAKLIYSDLPDNLSLLNLPFSTRTWNTVFYNTDYFQANKSLTYDKAIKELPNFGIKSAIEFACVVESAVSTRQFLEFSTENDEQDESPYEGWEKIREFYKQISAWALGERHLSEFSELLPPPNNDWPEEIKLSWNQLSTLETRRLAGNLEKLYSVPFLVGQFLASIDQRFDQVIINRVFSLGRAMTLSEIGRSLGITRERVRQLEKQAVVLLERFHRDGMYSPVLRKAKEMRELLGSALPFESLKFKNVVDEFTVDFSSDARGKVFAQGLLPWLAGPYKIDSEWLLIDKYLPDKSIEELQENCDERGIVYFEVLREVLLEMEIKEEFHEQWIKRLQVFLKIDDGILFIRGNVLDKAETLIRYHDRPMTAEEIVDCIGRGSVRSVRQRMMDDERFWRINKNNEFALAGTEGYDEYTSITGKIVEEIQLSGGSVLIEQLVAKLVTKYSVKKNSIMIYVSTPMFAVDEDGNVRLANIGETPIEIDDLSQTPSCYRTNDGFWSLRVRLDSNHLRGSGSKLPNSFAKELGCGLGDRINIETIFGRVVLSWPLKSSQGATIGSIKSVVESLHGNIGDYVFIIGSKPHVSFRLLTLSDLQNTASRICQLSLMLGAEYTNNEETATINIATALEVPISANNQLMLVDARDALNLRGEDDLARMIPEEFLSFDDYPKKIGDLP